MGGNGNQVNGANSLAGGGGAIVGGEGTFAWSDGSFSVSKEHLFAVNANNGVAVSTGSPNTIAALTINGDLRIQQYTSDTSSCNDKTLGTIKSVVASGNQLCACFCDGNGWQAVLDTPKCVKACPDPRNNLTLQCNTALWAATSESDYKHKFEPAWTGEILTGTVGCLTG
ncbi:MAG: hypothetical protein LBU27_08610 [Candidatus Peribacteria bacterium]|nr:hypothetical protein [Candidatus Peribacteria bacterium]